MKKKIIIPLTIIGVILIFAFCSYQEKELKKSKIENNYKQAVEYYENKDYEQTFELLINIPEGYKDRDKMYKEIEEYNQTYSSAVNFIEDKDYDSAVIKLNELPNGYKEKDLIINNINKIKALIENTWYDDPIDYDWYYEVTFSLSTYSDNLTLYIFEDEYSGNTFMNTYSDSISLKDLLEDGQAYVKSDERDDFNIDINNIESGEYTTYNKYITSTYKIKKQINSQHKRPNCIVKGCSYKADTSIVGFSGEIEYYCNEHYEQMSELANDMFELN